MKKNIAVLFAAALILSGCASKSSEVSASASAAAGTITATESTGKSADDGITREEAEEIALKHAGLKRGDLTSIRTVNDTENGRKTYDIEFWKDNTKYDYEIDVLTGDVISYEADTEIHSNVPSSTSITLKEAKEIALNHAGLKENEVTFLEEKNEIEDGALVYDIEFWKDSTEYDYEIDAATGKILSFDQDIESFSIPSQSGNTAGESITSDQALEIALKTAGLSRSDISRLKTETDTEHGKSVYEIEFHSGKTEYEFEIDAATGDVLKYKNEIDD
jgi:uncharacterized membrane protein YkoI